VKPENPLAITEDVKRRLGRSQVDLTTMWQIVTQLQSDMRWFQSEIDRLMLLVYRAKAFPVGGSDSAEPSSETERDE